MQNNKGFTLVELSIVLILIGLITTIIIIAQDMIGQAKMRSVIGETQKYNQAYELFVKQYNTYPGDFSTASSYWTGAVNGDGDQYIGIDTITDDESVSMFQHLALAGFIEGSFTGSYGAGIVIGSNAPSSDYSEYVTYFNYSSTLWSNYTRGNSLVLSGLTGNGWDDYEVNVIDAFNLDQKIDDGLPYVGKVIGYSNTSDACAATGSRLSDSPADLSTVSYKIDDDTVNCTMHFALGDYVFK